MPQTRQDFNYHVFKRVHNQIRNQKITKHRTFVSDEFSGPPLFDNAKYRSLNRFSGSPLFDNAKYRNLNRQKSNSIHKYISERTGRKRNGKMHLFYPIRNGRRRNTYNTIL